MKRIVVLASGSGSNLQALIDAVQQGQLPVSIAAVISDRPEAFALKRAAAAGIPALSLPLADRRSPTARAEFEGRLVEAVAAFSPDLVVLAGWMLILGQPVLERFRGRVINVHPALLPDGPDDEIESSCGRLPVLRGPHAVRDALRLGLPRTGATVHWVTPIVDTGPVLLREEVPILPGDNQDQLHERIKRVEHALLPRAVALALAKQEAEDMAGGHPQVILLLGSKSDAEHRNAIAQTLDKLGISHVTRIASAHKVTGYLLNLLQGYEQDGVPHVYITVAGRSNALSGVVDANSRHPVIACPPSGDRFGGLDFISMVSMPGGVAPLLVLEPSAAALAAAKILGVGSPEISQRVVERQEATRQQAIEDDQAAQDS